MHGLRIVWTFPESRFLHLLNGETHRACIMDLLKRMKRNNAYISLTRNYQYLVTLLLATLYGFNLCIYKENCWDPDDSGVPSPIDPFGS